MNHVIILGRQPELGLVELESQLGADAVLPFGRQAALVSRPLNLNDLGGAQKLGRIIYRGPTHDLNETPIDLDDLPLREGKITFGLSFYGLVATQKFVTASGLTLKKRLRDRGPVRFVAPQGGTTLSAAQVKFNGLVRDGFELIVAANGGEMVVAITQQIQDIDWYAVRDYQRPTRSAKVGMLPPKLAQIMINTTAEEPVYDPFCGTGVVLQEALLQNRSAIGSDLAPEMVEATRENLEWLSGIRTGLPTWAVSEQDARTVRIKPDNLAIVTEGYLGPNQTGRPSPAAYRQLKTDLGQLYRDSLLNWSGQIGKNSSVTLTAPVWHTREGWQGLDLVDQLSDLGYTLKRFEHVPSDALTYRRPNQIVGRQLLILRKS